MKTIDCTRMRRWMLILPALLLVPCLVGPATSQMVAASPHPQGGPSHRPADIVNVEANFFASSPGQSFTVYTVPSGKWLVLTDYDVALSGDFDMYERDMFGNLSPKRTYFSGLGFSSSVGLAFRPETSVVLIALGSGNSVSCSLMGYLANP